MKIPHRHWHRDQSDWNDLAFFAFWIKMSALDGGAVWLVGSLSPSMAFRALSVFRHCQKKSPHSLFSEVPWYPGLFPHCWYYKIPIQNNSCHLSAKPGWFSRSLSPAHKLNTSTVNDSQPPPPLMHIPPYIHTDTLTHLQILTAHTRTPTHSPHARMLKPHVWELLL